MTTISPVDDSYTGTVTGPHHPMRRTTTGATITKMSVGPMDNNAYVLTCADTGDQLLIDAANDAPELLALLDELPGTLRGILTTHGHFDHWQALEDVVKATGVPTMAGRADAGELPVRPDRLLDDGDEITVGNLTLKAIHLAGHTEGSIALALRDASDDAAGPLSVQLFTGDCLFPGGVGKTWQEGDFERLLGDVTSKLFDVYPDDTAVYPGHGSDTTLGAERPRLDEWRERGW
ncbi:MAG: MBL fold metallo-hydrolase [Gordonia sp. (in: high G+C Gram-positive bacteria)]|uniref:MBL fold metallo-hydrolase n=1 Tax=Gordonia sp. (in: high G+C Gram-positive bacteria) TaxID=84139 RepID=UPI0039E41532